MEGRKEGRGQNQSDKFLSFWIERWSSSSRECQFANICIYPILLHGIEAEYISCGTHSSCDYISRTSSRFPCLASIASFPHPWDSGVWQKTFWCNSFPFYLFLRWIYSYDYYRGKGVFFAICWCLGNSFNQFVEFFGYKWLCDVSVTQGNQFHSQIIVAGNKAILNKAICQNLEFVAPRPPWHD